MVVRISILLAVVCLAAFGQAADPARVPLEAAYSALAAKRYGEAIRSFRTAAGLAPERTAIRKDLAYTYLKAGETVSARDEFAEVVRLAPEDFHAALEYAFLCHETGRTQTARRIFDLLRRKADPVPRATAEQAFQNIDQLLKEGIERWTEAARANPNDFNAHRELAALAERRDELELAAEHYSAAWRIRPEQRSLLVDLGRVQMAMGKKEEARAALASAVGGGEPRAAEAAKELLTGLGLQPAGIDTEDVRALADRSYQAGYLQDALKYYSIAQQTDPSDGRVMLQLGWTNNLLKKDAQAYYWFGRARQSQNPAIAAEARRAYGNLRPFVARLRTTVWLYPTFSSRWRDVFAYGQVKLEWRLGRLPVRAYFSTRLVGDTRQLSGGANPQYLSQKSFLFAAGLATSYWHGLMLWAEAGRAVSYLPSSRNPTRVVTDYRGGVTFSKGYGQMLNAERSGAFFETNADGVFMSYFQNDFVAYSQNRFGYTLAPSAALGGLQMQWHWGVNASADVRRQYWANTVESGPGVRFRWQWMPPSWLISASFLRGAYALTDGNPWGRHYNDLRVGFWYAFTR